MEIKRASMVDSINKKGQNIYCNIKDLTNEASVEMFFVNRLLKDFLVQDKHILPKSSIKSQKLLLGRKQINYKPDYCIEINKKIRVIIDAKSPKENIYDWIEQCAHYSLILNRDKKTVLYFLLSNGLKTALFNWDSATPILELDFADFNYGNDKYEQLRKLLSPINLRLEQTGQTYPEHTIKLKKVDKEDAQKIFASCHKYIWKADKISPSPAFIEFVKIIFLKLYHDRMLFERYERGKDIPKSAVTFSTRWIEERESETTSPINDLHFKTLLKQIEVDISENKKNRIFDINEQINLKPQTIKGVVKKLESIDLYGIDEDL